MRRVQFLHDRHELFILHQYIPCKAVLRILSFQCAFLCCYMRSVQSAQNSLKSVGLRKWLQDLEASERLKVSKTCIVTVIEVECQIVSRVDFERQPTMHIWNLNHVKFIINSFTSAISPFLISFLPISYINNS